jgi:hypothetical protein
MVTININDFMSKIAQRLPLQVVWFDAKAKVMSANPAWLQAIGAARVEEMVGKSPSDYLSEAQAACLSEQLSQVIKTGKMQIQEQSAGAGRCKGSTAVRYPLPQENAPVTGVLEITFESVGAPEQHAVISETAPPEKFLLSGLVHELLAAKSNEYRSLPVRFQVAVADLAQFAFVLIQSDALRQSVAHLIDRAAANVKAKTNGSVILKLDANAETVTLTVHDNGRGMNFEMLDRMLNRDIHIGEHATGRDPGMKQVWKMLEQSKGVLNIETMLAEGTSILLTFPRTIMPNWIATQISLNEDSIVLVVDADESIHQEWKKRLDIYRHAYPDLQLHYFTEGRMALKFIAGLSQGDESRVVLLSDYELPGQGLNGVQIIEAGKVRNTTLVTRLHASPYLQRNVGRLGVNMLPKHLVPLIPIHFADGTAN